jgi:signal transduction histidine kinase
MRVYGSPAIKIRIMKAFLIIFLFFAVPAIAQQKAGAVFHLDKLSKPDTLLSGWNFHAGDDPRWAEQHFDDSKWQQADHLDDVTKFNELKKAGIGWIRLHIIVDSSITKQQLTAWINQNTASEIYLNGKLIKKYGSVNRDPSKTIAWSPYEELFDLKLQSDTEQVVAVRLSYESNLPYCSGNFIALPAFAMYVNSYRYAHENAQDYQQNVFAWTVIWSSLGGVFLIISFIYLIYYLFDKNQKTNLYYFIFSFLNLIFLIIAIPYYNNIYNVSAQMWTGLVFAADFIPAFLFLLLTVYALFQYQSRAVFKLLVLTGIGFICYLLLFDGAIGFLLCANGYIILTCLEGVRVSIWAVRKRKKNAGIILAGLICSVIFAAWAIFLDQTTIAAQVLNALSTLVFPLGMAFYLGLQNALINKKLKSTLVEVQILSKEKQQILAGQNEQLERQVTTRTAELNQSLSDLRSTQSQLIQREKMASLGELTAGIAHEIQNPLNFVNNFSEVNRELIDELETEANKGNLEEVKTIVNNIKGNEEKINHHGKRADAIVKGMLQHSRQSSGVREPTDVNVLCEEYARLAYHGFRAKEKEFSAKIEKDFNSGVGKINIIPQDMGSVLLNLINNAFYSVDEKRKTSNDGYEPTISICTKCENGKVEIRIRDNGNGIPQRVREKIFQPFFTTKPTGLGTGLGLSLSYDIIKSHGGEVTVNTKEGEFAEFVILLPG